MTTPMMKCGHAANAKNADGSPACAICALIGQGSSEVDPSPPDLSSRTAKCHCGKIEPSHPGDRAFFEHKPAAPHDRYYCGCDGWD